MSENERCNRMDTHTAAAAQAPLDADAQASFDDEVKAVLDGNVLVVSLQRACDALRDPRLERSHRLVLAELLEHMNRKVGMAWPSRETLAARTGYNAGTIENALYKLRAWGYIRWERRQHDKGGAGFYYAISLASMPREALQAEIATALQALRKETPRPAVETDTPRPAVEETPRPTMENDEAHSIREPVDGSDDDDAREGVVSTEFAMAALDELGLCDEVLGELMAVPDIRYAAAEHLKAQPPAVVVGAFKRAATWLPSCRSRNRKVRADFLIDGLGREIHKTTSKARGKSVRTTAESVRIALAALAEEAAMPQAQTKVEDQAALEQAAVERSGLTREDWDNVISEDTRRMLIGALLDDRRKVKEARR